MSAPPYSIAILGNDAYLAASPARPVQLMHAALAAGFDAVVPVSLGDELVAGETLRIAQLRGRRPVVQCACPFSLSQLCKREANLADITVAVAPAPVALARALRLERVGIVHVTFIGGCPGAQDPDIDLQVLPEPFLRGLTQKGIDVTTQPDVFSDRLPPDRRRYLSEPGGAPRSALVEAVLRRSVVRLDARTNPLLAVADALFDGGVTMVDPAGAYRCVCAGSDAASVEDGRAAITALEPARAMAPIFEAPAWLDLRPTEPRSVPQETEQPATPASPLPFAEAAQVAGGRGVTAVSASAAPVGASQGDAARRMYALGVRTARRRATLSPTTSAEIAQASMETHIPPTSPSLHAPTIDREVSVSSLPPVVGDRVVDTTAPPLRRAVTADNLLQRD